MSERIVLDTSVFVAALKSEEGASRAIVRLCLMRLCQPLLGVKLFTEYEDVLGRSDLFRDSPLTPRERDELLDAFLSGCEKVPVFHLWRPNLPDEGDNHLIELADGGIGSDIGTQTRGIFGEANCAFPNWPLKGRQNSCDDGEKIMATMTIRIPDAKHHRLRLLAIAPAAA